MTKNAEVTAFIEQIQIPWQIQVSEQLRELVHDTIPDVEERVQYKKPHFFEKRKVCCGHLAIQTGRVFHHLPCNRT